MVRENFTGRVFGDLKVVGDSLNRTNKGEVLWKCECLCGISLFKTTYKIKRENFKCKHTANSKSVTRHYLYPVFNAMKARCLNKNNKKYPNYGGRGITVCDRWLKENPLGFNNFLEDMGERPDGMFLDRKDNNLGYSRDNCRWVTRKQSNFNTRGRLDRKSRFKGVSLRSSGKWTVFVKGKNYGLFVNEEDAARKYNEVASMLYGEHAHLNVLT